MFTDIRPFQCREIITKAVCGKGRKFSQTTNVITAPHTPDTILGCWIINHSYKANRVGDIVEVVGSYEVNLWYSFDKNTKTEVIQEEVGYVEQVPLSYLDPHQTDKTSTVKAVCAQDPRCVEASLVDDRRIAVEVEKEFLVEVIGETKVNVVVCPTEGEMEEKGFDEELDGEFDEWQDSSTEADILLEDESD